MNATPQLPNSELPNSPNADSAPPPSEGRLPQSAPSPRRLFAIAVFAAIVGFGITLSFGYADHDPKPHAVRIAIAAPPAVRAKVAAGLERAEPGGFDLVPVPSAGAATHSVRSQSTAGALVVPPSGPVTIVTAGAEGVLQQQALTAALTAASRSMHRAAKSLDVAPLPSGDRAGLSSFVFGLGLLIPSVLGGLGLFLLGSRLRLWWRVTAAALFALLVACGGVLAMDTILGALTGASGALIGIGFLGALSFVLFVAALQAVVGLPAQDNQEMGLGLLATSPTASARARTGPSLPSGSRPAAGSKSTRSPAGQARRRRERRTGRPGPCRPAAACRRQGAPAALSAGL